MSTTTAEYNKLLSIPVQHYHAEDEMHCEPFIPKPEQHHKEGCWHDAVTAEHGNRNFLIRIQRIFFIMSGPAILLTLASLHTISVSFLIGVGLLFMFLCYFAILLRLIFINCGEREQTQLFRIYSLSSTPPQWAANFNIGYFQLLYRTHSIQSISELSAINGGVTKVMLNTLGAYTWISVVVHYATELKWQSGFGWDIADVSIVIGSAGLLLISVFELDPFNPKMQFMHYVGAALGCGTVFGFCLQQYSLHPNTYFYVALFLGFICLIGFCAWQIIGAATNIAQLPPSYTTKGGPNYNRVLTPLAKKIVCNYENIGVNAYSKMNILFEAIFLFVGALCLCLFLMNYENVCQRGCSTTIGN